MVRGRRGNGQDLNLATLHEFLHFLPLEFNLESLNKKEKRNKKYRNLIVITTDYIEPNSSKKKKKKEVRRASLKSNFKM